MSSRSVDEQSRRHFFVKQGSLTFFNDKKIMNHKGTMPLTRHTKECTKKYEQPPLCPSRLCGSIRFIFLKEFAAFFLLLG